MADFGEQVMAWTVKARANSDLYFRSICMELFGRIVDRTPVDTGNLRGSWSCGTSPAPMDADFSVKAGQRFHIVNYMPYAPVVEFGLYPNPPKGGTGKTANGFSTQAPQGMVRVTVAEFPQIVAEARP